MRSAEALIIGLVVRSPMTLRNHVVDVLGILHSASLVAVDTEWVLSEILIPSFAPLAAVTPLRARAPLPFVQLRSLRGVGETAARARGLVWAAGGRAGGRGFSRHEFGRNQTRLFAYR